MAEKKARAGDRGLIIPVGIEEGICLSGCVMIRAPYLHLAQKYRGKGERQSWYPGSRRV